MAENKEKIKKFLLIIIIAIICGIIFFYQTKKVGFHEDEGYTIASSVNVSIFRTRYTSMAFKRICYKLYEFKSK